MEPLFKYLSARMVLYNPCCYGNRWGLECAKYYTSFVILVIMDMRYRRGRRLNLTSSSCNPCYNGYVIQGVQCQ